MIATFVAFYLVAIPSGYIMAFHAGLGILGLWMGYLSGISIILIFYLTMIFMTADWDKII